MLRHPADGSQWRKVDRTFPTFTNDARNIRFGLSTDGMNSFGEHLNNLLCNYQIYYAIIRFIMYLNYLLCNYQIYYAFK